MSGEQRDDTCANLPVSRGYEFSGPTSLRSMAQKPASTAPRRAHEDELRTCMLTALRLAQEVWQQAGLPDTDTMALALMACERFPHLHATPRRRPRGTA
jgi:hypothetical protein